VPRIIPFGGNDDFRSLSPKLFNAGLAGPKYTKELAKPQSQITNLYFRKVNNKFNGPSLWF
jgi:hypothetical protein